MFHIQYDCILYIWKHHCKNLAMGSRAGTSNWGLSSFCLVCSLHVGSLSEHTLIEYFFFFFCCRCKHENLVELLGFSSDGAQPCLVYEYMPSGSLLDRLACLVCKIFLASSCRTLLKYRYLWNIFVMLLNCTGQTIFYCLVPCARRQMW